MINLEYRKINEYIISINEKILGGKNDIFYIANNVLTRNPYASSILSNDQKNKKILIFVIIKNLVKYYLKAFLFFSFYILKTIIYKLNRKTPIIHNKILIDTYFIMDKIIKTKKYKDSYFTNLDKYILKSEFTYFVKSFYGPAWNLIKFYQTLKILNKSDFKILSEYDFIQISDLIKIFCFIIVYPFKIIQVSKVQVKENTKFTNALFDSLNGSDFTAYIRYLVGKKLNKIFSFKKIYSWCEYQNIDKSFYKGLKETDKEVKIFGCQFLVPYDSWLNFFIPKNEEKFGLTPDIVLSNGKYYLKHIEIEKKLGVSLRYEHIFSLMSQKEELYILLLGTFNKKETEVLIQVIKNANLNGKILIRLHPTHNFSMYRKLIPSSWEKSTDESLDSAISRSYLVITTGGTGTSLEAVCRSKSTIIIDNDSSFTSIPLIGYGQGRIWDIVFNNDDIKKVYNKLMLVREQKPSEIKSIANWYKENFFVNPTRENIIMAFEDV